MGASWPWLLLAMALGPVVGSFIATWALRTVRQDQALVGRSSCDSCKTALGYHATLPIIAYVSLRGRCASCGGQIDLAHLAGEVAGGLVALSAVLSSSPVRGGLLGALGASLIATSVIDAKTQRLPDGLTILIAGLSGLLAIERSGEAFILGLGAAAAVVAGLQIVRWVGTMKNNEPGLGFGDVKLAAALALWLGLGATWMLVLAAASGLAVMAGRRGGGERLAFGPLIAAAAWMIGMSMEWGWWTGSI